MTALFYGLPFALCALAAWRLSARRGRAVWLQAAGGFLGWLIGIPAAIAIGIATERYWMG